MKVTLNSYYDEYWYDFKEYKALKKEYEKLKKENEYLKSIANTSKKNIDYDEYEKNVKLLDSKSVRIALKFRDFYIRILKIFKVKK